MNQVSVQPFIVNQLASPNDPFFEKQFENQMENLIENQIKNIPSYQAQAWFNILMYFIGALLGLFIYSVIKYENRDNYDEKQKSEIMKYQKYKFIFFITCIILCIIVGIVFYYKK
jgi:heme/copper-type cytochrome/quinol oxidase subunit 2